MSAVPDFLDELESESIYVIREVAASFKNPCILFSGGKDSIVLTHLAMKAFYPLPLPFPLLHIDTGHNFPETIAFRDSMAEKFGLSLVAGMVQDDIDTGRATDSPGENRNRIQSVTLKRMISALRYDACMGGARRDEEKARAKERFFSHRDSSGNWNPRAQRPELWSIFNAHHRQGEHFRVFPLNNWTESDIWNYILREQIALPSLYFAHTRKCVRRNGELLADSAYLPESLRNEAFEARVRFRTLGDITVSGAIESEADTLEAIVKEISGALISERVGRADDKFSASAMEDRKKEGYF